MSNQDQDRKTAFFEELLRHTPVSRRAVLQRAIAAGIATPAALRFTGQALAQTPTGTKGGGGTLVASQSGDPLTFNPDFQVDDNGFVPTLNIYSMLVTLNSDYAVIPELAKSWDVASDGLTITFHLVENAKWHDGQPVTSDDVKYTFDTIKATASAPANPFFAPVDSIDAPDPATVVFKMKSPSPSLIPFLGWYSTNILPAHIYKGTDWSKNPANQNPIGSGPFKFSKYSPGASLELLPNLDYFGEGPYLDKLIISIQPDANTAVQALTDGEVDLLLESPPRSQIATLQNTQGIKVIVAPIPSFYYMGFNMKKEPTSKPEVRKAICQAINKQQILDVALGGFGEVADTFYPKSIAWAADTSPDAAPPTYDKDAANKALDAIYPVKNGSRFKLTFPYFTASPEYADIATVMKQNLKDVSIDVDLVALEIGAWGTRMQSGDYDIGILGGLWGPDPDNLKIRVGTGGGVNDWFYSNPDVDKLLTEGASTVDQATRAQKYFAIEKILATDLPIMPLATVVLFYPKADTVTGLPMDDARDTIGLERFTLTKNSK